MTVSRARREFEYRLKAPMSLPSRDRVEQNGQRVRRQVAVVRRAALIYTLQAPSVLLTKSIRRRCANLIHLSGLAIGVQDSDRRDKGGGVRMKVELRLTLPAQWPAIHNRLSISRRRGTATVPVLAALEIVAPTTGSAPQRQIATKIIPVNRDRVPIRRSGRGSRNSFL